MTTTESINELSKLVSRIQNIDIKRFKTKESLLNWANITKSAYGVTEVIVDDTIECGGGVTFFLRCEMYFMKTSSDRWSKGYASSTNLLAVSNDLDRAVELMKTFLQDNPQYFVTRTDEYGNVFGKEKEE